MNLAFIGCGGISDAHLHGIVELRRAGYLAINITAVCDINLARAVEFSSKVKAQLGTDAAIYTDYKEMLAKESLDAVTVLVTHDLHHSVAGDCFAAGVHVQMQKPLAIAPSFGRQMIEDARKYDRILTLSEPSVLGAANVAAARAVQDGVLGQVYLVLDYATSAAATGFFGGTPWRHMKGKAGAGWINDHGVHRTHSFLEMIGGIREVFAYTEIFEKVRRGNGVTIQPTGEDAAVMVLRFNNGALGHWMCATAIHGEEMGGVYVYGSKGCLRPGRQLSLEGGKQIPFAQIIETYAPDVMKDPFAHAYLELWEAISDKKQPISSAEKGQEALSVVFAALESAHIGQPISVEDIMDGSRRTYEDTVIREMNLHS
ncbi:oxidoreductase [Paenibacillus baekrokdamisoli]|uniref:Oxidoreductase n=1 Tax=Paenibacillus baekrokdamisoli TaxID=1712516 RepID=A0A3G9JJD3_9BACL|nr:Gfo/Idh/MocA family oxidoreductase [Paenibacillus baekrokdamisoli]MBB3071820.1 putative dehydrogenase [Paenibacillus baekrokdamisoli]BBH24198.1 oxidoreductase [Paenibacillus baekrokdamisoli]